MPGTRELNPLSSFDGWELEEKLSHVRRILDRPGSVEAPPPRHDCGKTQFAWLSNKATVAAGVCSAVLLSWSAIASRQDLLAPAAAAAVIGNAAWLASRLIALRAAGTRG